MAAAQHRSLSKTNVSRDDEASCSWFVTNNCVGGGVVGHSRCSSQLDDDDDKTSNKLLSRCESNEEPNAILPITLLWHL
jgi:hypothetical protein